MRYAITKKSGRICFFSTGPESVVWAQCSDGQQAVPVGDTVSDVTHYINTVTGNANKRDATPCTPSRTELPADGETALTLSQMRPNTVITVTGPVSATMTVAQGGSDTIRFHKPGTYTITAEAPFPAMPKEITINAT